MANKRNAERGVKFVTEQSGEAMLTLTAGNVEDSLTADSSQGALLGADVMRDSQSPMWGLICDCCWLSYQFIRSQSSAIHLQFLAAILRSHATSDWLLTDLMIRAELLTADAAVSVHRYFLEQMILPLVEQFSDSKGSGYILSIMSLIYAELEAIEQVSIVREITVRAARNSLICAEFLSEIISEEDLSDEVRSWLCSEEFGQFVIQLTEDICQRRLMMTSSDEVADKSMLNDQSRANDKFMDDSHWKLLCACLRSDQESGMLKIVIYHLQHYTGWAKKNRTCLSIDNSAMVSGRKTCNMSKVSECCKE